jgi:phosphate transport system permease protein
MMIGNVGRDRRLSRLDVLFRLLVKGATFAAAGMLAVMLLAFLFEGIQAFLPGSFSFLFGREWRPEFLALFGLLPLLHASLLVTLGAVIAAAPAAVLAAVWASFTLSRTALLRLRRMADFTAAIPTVVYGFIGLTALVPLLRSGGRVPSGNSLGAAILVLAVMLFPRMFSSFLRAFGKLPSGLLQAGTAAGASRFQLLRFVLLPASARLLLAGVLDAIMRAAGEAVVVVMVAGNSPRFASSLADSVRTLSGTLLLETASAQGQHFSVLFTIGLLLLVTVIILQTLVHWLKNGGRYAKVVA